MVERLVRARVTECAICDRATVCVVLRLHANAWHLPEQAWNSYTSTSSAFTDPRTQLRPVRFSSSECLLRFCIPSLMNESDEPSSCTSSTITSLSTPTEGDGLFFAQDATITPASMSPSMMMPEELNRCPFHSVDSNGVARKDAACTCPKLAIWVLQLRNQPQPCVQSVGVAVLPLTPVFLTQLTASIDDPVGVICNLISCDSLVASSVVDAMHAQIFTSASSAEMMRRCAADNSVPKVGYVGLELTVIRPIDDEFSRNMSNSAPIISPPLPEKSGSLQASEMGNSAPVLASAELSGKSSSSPASNSSASSSANASGSSNPTTPKNSDGSQSAAVGAGGAGAVGVTGRSLSKPMDGSMRRVLIQTAPPPVQAPHGSSDYLCSFTVWVHAAANLPVVHSSLPSVFALLRPETRKPQQGGEKAASLVERKKKNAVWRTPLRLFLTQNSIENENMHVALTDRHSRQHLLKCIMSAVAVRPFVQHHVSVVFNSVGSQCLMTVERDPVMEELLAFRDDSNCAVHLSVSSMSWMHRGRSKDSTTHAIIIVAHTVNHLRRNRSQELLLFENPEKGFPFKPVFSPEGTVNFEDLPESDCIVSPISDIDSSPSWGSAKMSIFLDTDEFDDAPSASSSGDVTSDSDIDTTDDSNSSGGDDESSTGNNNNGGVIFDFFDCLFAKDQTLEQGTRVKFLGFASLAYSVLCKKSKKGTTISMSLPVTTSPDGSDAIFRASFIVEDSIKWLGQKFSMPQLEDDSDECLTKSLSDDDGSLQPSPTVASSTTGQQKPTSISLTPPPGTMGATARANNAAAQSRVTGTKILGRGNSSGNLHRNNTGPLTLSSPSTPQTPKRAGHQSPTSSGMSPLRSSSELQRTQLQQQPQQHQDGSPSEKRPQPVLIGRPPSRQHSPTHSKHHHQQQQPQQPSPPQQQQPQQPQVQQPQTPQSQPQPPQSQQDGAFAERPGSGSDSSIIVTTTPAAARAEVRQNALQMISQNEALLTQSLERVTQERDALAEQLSVCSSELSHLRSLFDSSTLLREYRRQSETLSTLARDNARIPELEYRLRKQAKEIEALRCIVLQMQEEQQQQQQQQQQQTGPTYGVIPVNPPKAPPPTRVAVQPQYQLQQQHYSTPPPTHQPQQPYQAQDPRQRQFYAYNTAGRLYQGGLVQ